MPGAVEEKRAIVDQTLKDGGGPREIRQGEQPQSGRNEFPGAQGQQSRGKDRSHLPHPFSQPRPPKLGDREKKRYREEVPKENKVGPRFHRRLGFRNKPVRRQADQVRNWDRKPGPPAFAFPFSRSIGQRRVGSRLVYFWAATTGFLQHESSWSARINSA